MLHAIQELPTPEQLRQEIPMPDKTARKIAEHATTLSGIIKGEDPRNFLVVGPCSAWPEEAVLEYARALQKIAEEVRNEVVLVMRVFIEKPRSTHGWTGPLHQPDPYAASDLAKGLRYCRQMMVDVANLGLPIADEALFTENGGHFNDALSYITIGARSTTNQGHRATASGLEVPVGMKNPTSGNIQDGVNGVIAAQRSHDLSLQNTHYRSTGNPLAHLILRGGDSGPNYDLKSLREADSALRRANVKNPRLVVDVSHGNSGKDAKKQPDILLDTLRNMEENPEIMQLIAGWMVESFIESGKQDHTKTPRSKLVYGKSITDSCISLDDLRPTIFELAERLKALRKKQRRSVITDLRSESAAE